MTIDFGIFLVYQFSKINMVDDNDKDGVIKVYMKSVNGVYSQSQVVENFG